MNKIGIDIGASLMKMVEYDGENIINKLILDNKQIASNFEQFIKNNKIDLSNIEKICVTGVNNNKFPKNKYDLEVKFVDEFRATSQGALKLANKENALIASVRNWHSIY